MHIRRTDHAPLYRHAAERTLEPIAEAAHVLLAAVELDAVVVAEHHEVAVHVRIPVEPAVLDEVAVGLHRVVPAMQVASGEVAPADDRGMVWACHHDRLRAGGMRIAPAVRRAVRIVDPAPLHHNLAAPASDTYRAVEIDAPSAGRRCLRLITLPALVVTDFPDAAPPADVAVADAHGDRVRDQDGVASRAADHRHVVDQHVRRSADHERRTGGRGVGDDGAGLHRVADPTVRRTLARDAHGEFDFRRIHRHGPRHRHVARPCAKGSGRKRLAVRT